MAGIKVFAGNILVGAAIVLLSVFGPVQFCCAAEGIAYTVVEDDTLWGIAIEFGTSTEAIMSYNNLDTELLQIGQSLLIPNQSTGSLPGGSGYNTATSHDVKATTPYTVVEGDTLWGIAIKFGTSTEALMSFNNLDTEFLHIGQSLLISSQSTGSLPGGSDYNTAQSLKGTTAYTVVEGDTLWDLAVRFGTTDEAIIAINNTDPDSLMIGQSLTIPAGTSIPQVSRGASRPTTPAGPAYSGYGELIPWPDVDELFPRGSTATLQDFETGKQFRIYRLFGGNHADCEPLTPADTKIMKEIYGGQWSWDRRAALLLLDGRSIAASMAGMPHGTSEDITDNNFAGMFDLHFYKSRTHGTNSIDPAHQAAVHEAAGR